MSSGSPGHAGHLHHTDTLTLGPPPPSRVAPASITRIRWYKPNMVFPYQIIASFPCANTEGGHSKLVAQTHGAQPPPADWWAGPRRAAIGRQPANEGSDRRGWGKQGNLFLTSVYDDPAWPPCPAKLFIAVHCDYFCVSPFFRAKEACPPRSGMGQCRGPPPQRVAAPGSRWSQCVGIPKMILSRLPNKNGRRSH